MELEEAILSACNMAPDLVFIDPVLFAEEWREKTGLGGCFADLAEQGREQVWNNGMKGCRFWNMNRSRYPLWNG